jgi:hypothetical protein
VTPAEIPPETLKAEREKLQQIVERRQKKRPTTNKKKQ